MATALTGTAAQLTGQARADYVARRARRQADPAYDARVAARPDPNYPARVAARAADATYAARQARLVGLTPAQRDAYYARQRTKAGRLPDYGLGGFIDNLLGGGGSGSSAGGGSGTSDTPSAPTGATSISPWLLIGGIAVAFYLVKHHKPAKGGKRAH